MHREHTVLCKVMPIICFQNRRNTEFLLVLKNKNLGIAMLMHVLAYENRLVFGVVDFGCLGGFSHLAKSGRKKTRCAVVAIREFQKIDYLRNKQCLRHL